MVKFLSQMWNGPSEYELVRWMKRPSAKGLISVYYKVGLINGMPKFKPRRISRIATSPIK